MKAYTKDIMLTSLRYDFLKCVFLYGNLRAYYAVDFHFLKI